MWLCVDCDCVCIPTVLSRFYQLFPPKTPITSQPHHLWASTFFLLNKCRFYFKYVLKTSITSASIALWHPLLCDIHCSVTSMALWHPLFCDIHCFLTSIVMYVLVDIYVRLYMDIWLYIDYDYNMFFSCGCIWFYIYIFWLYIYRLWLYIYCRYAVINDYIYIYKYYFFDYIWSHINMIIYLIVFDLIYRYMITYGYIWFYMC